MARIFPICATCYWSHGDQHRHIDWCYVHAWATDRPRPRCTRTREPQRTCTTSGTSRQGAPTSAEIHHPWFEDHDDVRSARPKSGPKTAWCQEAEQSGGSGSNIRAYRWPNDDRRRLLPPKAESATPLPRCHMCRGLHVPVYAPSL
jgi:hypothetical protein